MNTLPFFGALNSRGNSVPCGTSAARLNLSNKPSKTSLSFDRLECVVYYRQINSYR